MKFQVSPKEGSSYILEIDRLLEIIFRASIDKNKEEERSKLIELSNSLTTHLFKTKAIMNSKLIDIILIAFTAGYYYSQFMNKNNVKIIEE